ncbi:MAG: hypothetical protein MJ252_12445 [archaeon]|nr:hypothetical protein [archaeon]
MEEEKKEEKVLSAFQKKLQQFQKGDKEQQLIQKEKELRELEKKLKKKEADLLKKQKDFEKTGVIPTESFESPTKTEIQSVHKTNIETKASSDSAHPVNVEIDTSEIQSLFVKSFDSLNKNINSQLNDYKKNIEESIGQLLTINQENIFNFIKDKLGKIKKEITDSETKIIKENKDTFDNFMKENKESMDNLIKENKETMNNLIQQPMTEINELKTKIDKMPITINQTISTLMSNYNPPQVVSQPIVSSDNQEEIQEKMQTMQEQTNATNALVNLNLQLSEKQLSLNQIEGELMKKEEELNKINRNINEGNEKHSNLLQSIDSASKELSEIHSQIKEALNELNEAKKNTKQIKAEIPQQYSNNVSSYPTYNSYENKNTTTVEENNNIQENNYNNVQEVQQEEQPVEAPITNEEQPIENEEKPVTDEYQQNYSEPQQEIEQPPNETNETIENPQPAPEEEKVFIPPTVADPNNPKLEEVRHKFERILSEAPPGTETEVVDSYLEKLSWPERNLIEIYSIGQNCKSIFAFNPFYTDAEEIEVDFDVKFPSFHSYINVSPYVYLSGGKYEEESSPSSIRFYRYRRIDKKQFSREALTPMNEARKYHATVYIPYSNEICAIGGTKIKSCEKYSIDNNEWSELPNLLSSRERASCCVYNENMLYVFFGFDRSKSHYITTIEKLNLKEPNQWESISVPGNQNFLKKQSFGLTFNEDKTGIIIIGGINASRKICKDIIEYNFEENKATMMETSSPISASFNEPMFKDMFNGLGYLYTENFSIIRFDPKTKEFIQVE